MAARRRSPKAKRNAEINGLNVQFEVGDAFQTLDRLGDEERKFDAIVLDPPKFAKSRSAVNAALQAYHRINKTAVALLPPGGILAVTNSCSGTVSARRLSADAQRRRPEVGPRHSDPRATRCRCRSSGCCDLPGDGIPQVLHLPRFVIACEGA